MRYADVDDLLLEKAQILLEMGGMSGTTRAFLEELLWFGWAAQEEARHFQAQHMRELIVLYSLN